MLRIYAGFCLGLVMASCSGHTHNSPIKISSTSGNLPLITQKVEEKSLIQDQLPSLNDNDLVDMDTKGDQFFQAIALYGDEVKPGDIIQFSVDLSSMNVEGFDIYQYIKYDTLEGGKVVVNMIQIPILGSTDPSVEFPYEISETTIGDSDATGFVVKYWLEGEEKELEQSIEYRIKKVDKS